MRIKNINTNAWYWIPGFEGKYQINFNAQIRHTCKNGKIKELHPYVKPKTGRLLVKLSSTEYEVKALMARTFIGTVPKGYVVHHKNALKSDCHLGNLEIISKNECGSKYAQKNDRSFKILKIDNCGEIIDCYKSAREAGRQNFMSYQTVLDRVNGKCKSLFAPDGYIYIKDDEKAFNKALRRIEMHDIKETGAHIVKAPAVEFDF